MTGGEVTCGLNVSGVSGREGSAMGHHQPHLPWGVRVSREESFFITE